MVTTAEERGASEAARLGDDVPAAAQEKRDAAEAAVRLGDQARVRRALDKCLRVREEGTEEVLLLVHSCSDDHYGGFELARGASVGANRLYAEQLLIEFIDEVLS